MTSPEDPSSKRGLRERILARRATVSKAEKVAADRALARHVEALAKPGQTVCAYVPTRREPGSTALLTALSGTGARILLPVAREPGPMRWAEFTAEAELVDAPFGLREPAGPVLSPAEVATASWLLVPALAVDRFGVRLGRGAGFYDRTLGMAAPDARIVAVVFDHELVEHLPSEPHDRKVGWVLTPGRGLVPLGGE